jgi:WD40 repeat protein
VTIIPTNTGKLISGINSAVDGDEIAIWDLETNACIMTIAGDPYHAFLRDGKLISHSWNGRIKIWNLENGVCERTIARDAGQLVQCVILSEDGKKLIYGSQLPRSEIEIWNLESGIRETTLRGHRSSMSLVLTKDGKLISGECRESCFIGGGIRIWNLETGKCEKILKGHDNNVKHLVLTKNGKLISGSATGQIKIWNLESGDCEMTFKIDNEQTESFNPAMHSLTLTEEGELVARFESDHSTSVKIKVSDFGASKIEIFQELAEIFERCQEVPGALIAKDSQLNMAMERFLRMPAEDKEKIYGELYDILKPFPNDHYTCVEHAFHSYNAQSFTPQQRAQAIKNYLSEYGMATFRQMM